MSRPLKLFAYKVGRELHKDVDEVMGWPLDKLYEYIAFYMTENESWKEKYSDSLINQEAKSKQIMQMLARSSKK